MWFMIFATRYESYPKATVWNGFGKIMSVKIHVLKKAFVSKQVVKCKVTRNWSLLYDSRKMNK